MYPSTRFICSALQNKSQVWQLTDSASSNPCKPVFLTSITTIPPNSLLLPFLGSHQLFFIQKHRQIILLKQAYHATLPWLPLPHTPTKSSDAQAALKGKIKFPFLLLGKSLHDLWEAQISDPMYSHSAPWNHYPLATLTFLFFRGDIELAVVSVWNVLFLYVWVASSFYFIQIALPCHFSWKVLLDYPV